MSERNRQTIRRYWEQQAAGGVTMDDLTRHNFGIIRQTLDGHDRALRQAALSIGGLR